MDMNISRARTTLTPEEADSGTILGLPTRLFVIVASSAGGGLIILIVCIVCICCCCCRKRRKRNASDSIASIGWPVELDAPPLPRRQSKQSLVEIVAGDDGSMVCVFNPLLEIGPELRQLVQERLIPREKVKLGHIVGKGHFGQVYWGLLETPEAADFDTKVAVKTLKYKSDGLAMVTEFLQEAMIMRDFNHPNVLTLIGICFAEDGSPMAVLPFMANGDLKRYISDPQMNMSVRELLTYGVDIAHGMAYLSKMKFVHRDLAARNCMVDDKCRVKVADFGLSRDLNSLDYYTSDNKVCIPVRWMAPESLQRSCFTYKTDVWSYGVLLWELLTRGALPYQDVDSWEIKAYLLAGNRLDKPKYCPETVFQLMKNCWNIDPWKRPNFDLIACELRSILDGNKFSDKQGRHEYINVPRNLNPKDYRATGTTERQLRQKPKPEPRHYQKTLSKVPVPVNC